MKNFEPKAWLLPQPVLIIGTYNADGTSNAMNAAWAGQWDTTRIMISLGNHATTDNLERSPDFTVAYATVSTMIAADYVGLVSGRRHPDKIVRTGWKSKTGTKVNAPIFDVFPMTLECRATEKLCQSESGYYLIAEIVNIVCDEKYLDQAGNPNVESMQLISFDPISNSYIELGERVGDAFHVGLQLKK